MVETMGKIEVLEVEDGQRFPLAFVDEILGVELGQPIVDENGFARDVPAQFTKKLMILRRGV